MKKRDKKAQTWIIGVCENPKGQKGTKKDKKAQIWNIGVCKDKKAQI